jgi:hypothetical protein
MALESMLIFQLLSFAQPIGKTGCWFSTRGVDPGHTVLFSYAKPPNPMQVSALAE